VAKLIVQTAVKNQDLHPQSYMLSVHAAYENLYRSLEFGRYKEVTSGFLAGLHVGMSQIYKELQNAFKKIPMERLVGLYAEKDESNPWDNLVAAIAEIVYDSLASLANSFEGIDDRNWSHAISVFHDIFPSFGDQAVGLDPLQQRLAIKLVDKLRENMKGYYPSISRVLLAVIGPYDRREQITKAMPAGIIREAVYKELQKLKDLHTAKPDKFEDYFPPQIRYDAATDYNVGFHASASPGAVLKPACQSMFLTRPLFRQSRPPERAPLPAPTSRRRRTPRALLVKVASAAVGRG